MDRSGNIRDFGVRIRFKLTRPIQKSQQGLYLVLLIHYQSPIMKIVYSRGQFPESFSKAIFLAGPSPRSADVESWRPTALEYLEKCGYDGVVFVPENGEGSAPFDYELQVAWEEEGLNKADAIVFWVPRDLDTMPGLTTNIEWGAWHKSGKAIFGAPEDAPSMKYFRRYADKLRIPQANSLEGTLDLALDSVGDGEMRHGGECDVPLFIWRQASFQNWYRGQVQAGNRLDGARCEWHCPKPDGRVFCQVLHPKVFVTSENRHKTNEIIISRPDVSAVMAYFPGQTLLESEVVLVREFRSNAITEDGFVRELPGGSSTDLSASALETAADELSEETGVRLPAERFVDHGSRQCLATMITHRCSLFSVELSEEEIEQFRETQERNQSFSAGGSELTFVEVRTVASILESKDVDWTDVGMILEVLQVGRVS